MLLLLAGRDARLALEMIRLPSNSGGASGGPQRLHVGDLLVLRQAQGVRQQRPRAQASLCVRTRDDVDDRLRVDVVSQVEQRDGTRLHARNGNQVALAYK